jgi:hypothetical protein
VLQVLGVEYLAIGFQGRSDDEGVVEGELIFVGNCTSTFNCIRMINKDQKVSGNLCN